MSVETIEPTAQPSLRDAERRAQVHAALSDPHRVRIVDELALSDRSPGELAASLGIGTNLLAHHLGVLEDVGLIERLRSAGDGRRKYLRLVPETTAGIAEPMTALIARRVLFVCTENSARSQLAAAAWNALHEVPAASAGTRPAPRVHPEAVRAAERAGLDLTDMRPRSVADAGRADLVVTVCDIAHEELRSLADPPALHWSIPDPAPAAIPSAFDESIGRIVARIQRLAPVVRPPGARPGASRRSRA
jgi:protein-tyrosine-phosphatase